MSSSREGTGSAMHALIALVRGEDLELDEIDWHGIRGMAEWHGVMPIVAAKALEGAKACDAIRAQLEQARQAIAQRNLLLTGELLSILRAFNSAGVQALAYKGAALAAAFYGDIAKREFGDIDLLIRPESIAEARRVLEANGFVPWAEFAQLTPAQERAYLRSGYHFQYSRPDGSTPIELHWNVSPRMFGISMPMEQLFRRAVPVRIGGNVILAPSAEDHLVLLCIHGAKHMWDKLRLIADIAQLLAATPNLNVEQVLRFAAELRARRMILLGLTLANSLFGTVLPEAVMSALNHDRAVTRLAARVITNLPRCRSAEEYHLSAHRFYFDVRERPQDKLRYLYRLAFEPSLNDARLLGDSPAAAMAGGWLRPFRLAGAVMRHSFAGIFRRTRPSA